MNFFKELLLGEDVSVIDWTQPLLTSSSPTTFGGDNFACVTNDYSGGGQYNSVGSGYQLFDGNTGTEWISGSTITGMYFTWYSPDAINITQLACVTGAEFISAYTLYGSNDNSSWETIGTATLSGNTTNYNSFSSNTKYYKYHMLLVTGYSTRPRMREIYITAKYMFEN